MTFACRQFCFSQLKNLYKEVVEKNEVNLVQLKARDTEWF